jgi:hypothetical protein
MLGFGTLILKNQGLNLESETNLPEFILTISYFDFLFLNLDHFLSLNLYKFEFLILHCFILYLLLNEKFQ